jgi:hypothetical protein
MSDGTPQFTTAEYPARPVALACKGCGKPLGDPYFRANGTPICPACAQAIQRQADSDTKARFARGMLFGVGGAILGLVLYVVFALVTGLMIGFVSLAVGYLVGKAITIGSGGRGGRRYQIAAVVLTYAAVSLSAVPIAISMHNKARKAEQQTELSAPTGDHAAMSPARAVATLVFVGLASPFLELSNPAQGLIGLVILFVGIRIAWRLTAGRSIKIEGPLRAAGPATAS